MALTMSRDGGSQIDQRVDVLELARAHDGQEALNGPFAVVTPRTE